MPVTAELRAALGLLCLFCLRVGAGESFADHYQKVKFPHYEEKILASELFAEEADALGLAAGQARVSLRGVTIRIFEKLDPELAAVARPDTVPPLRMRVTSRRGSFQQVRGAGANREDLALLEEDVVAVRFAPLKPGADPAAAREVETEIAAGNAQWSNSRRVLTGTGPVRIRQPGLELTGVDFTYTMQPGSRPDQAVKPEEERSARRGQGWVEIDRDVLMRFLQSTVGRKETESASRPLGVPENATGLTTVTCKGLTSYDLATREVQFQDAVSVRQERIEMKSDRLRIAMEKGDPPVREIIAWDNVVIHGRGPEDKDAEGAKAEGQAGDKEGGKEVAAFTAHGAYARYIHQTSEILLSDARKDSKPWLEIGTDRVSDALIRIETKNNEVSRVRTEGGAGEATLNTIQTPGADGKGGEAGSPWKVRYDRSLTFQRAENKAVFEGNVRLVRDDLALQAEFLHLDLAEGAVAGEAEGEERGIRKMRALKNVIIDQAGRRGTAAAAEMDTRTRTLILTGPPAPQILDPGKSRLQASRIELQQADAATGGLSVIRGQGPCSFVFVQKRLTGAEDHEDLSTAPGAVTIRCSGVLLYDEQNRTVHFEEKVVAATEPKEEDWVLSSDKLDVLLEERKPEPEGPRRDDRREDRREDGAPTPAPIRRIAASGGATLQWGDRNCKAAQIIRDYPLQVITLHGAAGEPAMIWQDGSNSFAAPKIIATVAGDTVRADGPGELGFPGDEGPKAVVSYDGDVVYRALPGQTGKAMFKKNVTLRRADLAVRGDEMEAELEEETAAMPAATSAVAAGEKGVKQLPRRLRRVIMRGNVVVTRGTRTAKGLTGEMLVRASGDVITLRGGSQKPVEIVDREGMRLLTPAVSIVQATGVVTGEGPGELQVTSLESLKTVGVGRGRKQSVQYVLRYDGQLVYNQLARRVRFQDNVRMKQDFLEGQADRFELLLAETEGAEPREGGAGEALQVRSLEASGRARFKRFVPVTGERDKRINPLDRPGRTVFTKSDIAFYDVQERVIRLTGGPPQAIQQTVMATEDDQVKRSRVHLTASEALELDVVKGDIKAYPRPKITYQQAAGPIQFEGD